MDKDKEPPLIHVQYKHAGDGLVDVRVYLRGGRLSQSCNYLFRAKEWVDFLAEISTRGITESIEVFEKAGPA